MSILGINIKPDQVSLALVGENGIEGIWSQVFDKGTINTSKGEVSITADRQKIRSSRRLKAKARKRKIDVLRILSREGLCPSVTDAELSAWKQDKGAACPDSPALLDWWRNTMSPYHARRICVRQKLDLNNQKDRYILGRALYHMCQRRGFLTNAKSVETQSQGEVKKGIKSLEEAISGSGCTYLGEYFAKVLDEGGKVRTQYTARQQYEEEFSAICRMQGLDASLEKELHDVMFLNDKLRSQKGRVGRCSFERNKRRCALSHPLYEEFRMRQFINNIRVKGPEDESMRCLSSSEMKKVIPLFWRRSKKEFPFSDIAHAVAGKKTFGKEGEADVDYQFNYHKDTSVIGSPVTALLVYLFGEDFYDVLPSVYYKSQGKTKDQVLDDVWHGLTFHTISDESRKWAQESLNLSEEKLDVVSRFFAPSGYGSLSLKAIRKILVWLRRGYTYDRAVFYANVPVALGMVAGSSRVESLVDELDALYQDCQANPEAGFKPQKECLGLLLDNGIPTDKIYVHQNVQTYPSAPVVDGVSYFGSPRVQELKNPTVERAMFRFRAMANRLIEEGVINSETQIRFNMSRELHSINVRAAIRELQKSNEQENDKASKALWEYFGEGTVFGDREILKYRLWEEQNHICPYTGREIALDDFLGNVPSVDIEHIIPVSRGGDDRLANHVLCDSHFNRNVKGDRVPVMLGNHDKIMERIEAIGWQKEIYSLEGKIRQNKSMTRNAQDPDSKARLIKQRYKFIDRLSYLKDKLSAFGDKWKGTYGRNRSERDTVVIRRYMSDYLKTVFGNGNIRYVKEDSLVTFRKAWGLGKKDLQRNNIEGCVDAVVTACISGEQYRKWEKYMIAVEEQRKSISSPVKFDSPWKGFAEDVRDAVEGTIIPRKQKDKLFKEKRVCVRVRGKIKRDANGNPVYSRGDIARGSLNDETSYGAIMIDGQLQYVTRKKVSSFIGKDNELQKLLTQVSRVVDKAIREKMKKVILEKGVKALASEVIYQDDACTIPVKKVRVISKDSKMVAMRPHRDRSKHDYKQYQYLAPGGNYCLAVYEQPSKGKKRDIEYLCRSFFDSVKIAREQGQEFIVPETYDGYPLMYVLKKGTHVLMYENSADEVYKADKAELCKRLYRVTAIFGKQVEFSHCHHTGTGQGLSGCWKDDGLTVMRRIMPVTKIYALVEGKDFTISDIGEIRFI